MEHETFIGLYKPIQPFDLQSVSSIVDASHIWIPERPVQRHSLCDTERSVCIYSAEFVSRTLCSPSYKILSDPQGTLPISSLLTFVCIHQGVSRYVFHPRELKRRAPLI